MERHWFFIRLNQFEVESEMQMSLFKKIYKKRKFYIFYRSEYWSIEQLRVNHVI